MTCRSTPTLHLERQQLVDLGDIRSCSRPVRQHVFHQSQASPWIHCWKGWYLYKRRRKPSLIAPGALPPLTRPGCLRSSLTAPHLFWFRQKREIAERGLVRLVAAISILKLMHDQHPQGRQDFGGGIRANWMQGACTSINYELVWHPFIIRKYKYVRAQAQFADTSCAGSSPSVSLSLTGMRPTWNLLSHRLPSVPGHE